MAKPKRPEEALANPLAMAGHLERSAVSTKMTELEHGDHEYEYRVNRSSAIMDAKRREIERSYGPLIDDHLLYVPEGYRRQLKIKYIALLLNTRIRDYSQVERVLSKLPAECHAVRKMAKAMGVAVPGPFDCEGVYPPLGIFDELEIEHARQS